MGGVGAESKPGAVDPEGAGESEAIGPVWENKGIAFRDRAQG